MPRTCIRCQKNPAIDNSHVVPSFFFKRLKADSPVPFLIHSANLGKAEQDGWKTDHLCGDASVSTVAGTKNKSCEQLVSATEGWFASNVYHPFMDGTATSVGVTDEFIRFTASLAFRGIQWLEDHHGPAAAYLKPLFQEALAVFDGKSSQDIYFYASALHPVRNDMDWPPGINGYLYRAVDILSIPDWLDFAMNRIANVVVKGPRFLFVITDRPLENFKVSSLGRLTTGGTLDVTKNMDDLLHFFRLEFSTRALQMEENWTKLPEKRRDKITAKAGTPGADQTETHASWEFDNELAKFHEETRKQAGQSDG